MPEDIVAKIPPIINARTPITIVFSSELPEEMKNGLNRTKTPTVSKIKPSSFGPEV